MDIMRPDQDTIHMDWGGAMDGHKGSREAQNLIKLQEKLVPDLMKKMRQRYRVLRQVYFHQPVGRRTLADRTGLTERVLRAEVGQLRDQGLLAVEPSGVRLTDQGEQLLAALGGFFTNLDEWAALEKALAGALGVREAVVVPGDAAASPETWKEMAYQAAVKLRALTQAGDVIAVSGGSTLAAVAEAMPEGETLEVTVLPTRGGMGEQWETEANHVAAVLAQRMGARYTLFHVPDRVGPEAYRSLLQDPYVKDMLAKIRHASIVVHGIGNAMRMAERRRLPNEEMDALRTRGAVGEALGYYVDRKGNIVGEHRTFGIRREEMSRLREMIAVAGGQSKAEAIAAVCRAFSPTVLVTDEAAAREMLRGVADV
jgi:central glycolytic genes regulator